MALDFQSMVFYGLLIIVAYSIFQGYTLRNKVYCTFRRRDRTKIYKWAKAINGYRIEFDNAWYYINIKRVVLSFKWVGILPLWIRTLDFTADKPYAQNPDNFDNSAESPEERKAYNIKDDMEAANEGSKRSLAPSGKVAGLFGGGLGQILMIGGILLALYFSYTAAGKVDKVGTQGNVTQTQIQQVQQSINSLQSAIDKLGNK